MFGIFESENPINDIDRGRSALTYFHNYSVNRFGSAYPHVSRDNLAVYVGRGHADIFLDGLGFAINQIDMRESQVKDAMESLASRSQGRTPDQNSFFKSLSDRASALTFADYVYGAPEISKGIAKDAIDLAEDVGNTVKFFATPTGVLLVVGVLAVVGIGYLKLNKVV